jgi:hypothetical protein
VLDYTNATFRSKQGKFQKNFKIFS